MPKKKPAEPSHAETVQRFEGALRKALSTPPDAPRKKGKRKKKRTKRAAK